ncbi:hypothetical protein Z043_107114 [Scleropages formosus]|uniref:SMB domain-containing protein n=1 Tax=Scleropages formosus TaxID=113540 RepID=A0A0P7UYI9_SCLFO|nr:hypothetical protein Z043_107114 [Scleropages formosus]
MGSGDIYNTFGISRMRECISQSRKRWQRDAQAINGNGAEKRTVPDVYKSSYITLPFTVCKNATGRALISPATCKGRCGEPFSRGRICHCDRDCLLHNECCKDYESACTTGDSCVGRCGEPFKRGRLCNCDPSCALYDQCCPDYRTQCAAGWHFIKREEKNKFVFTCCADISSDTNLCNLQPIDGVTVLFNGTIVVFRGDFFWTLDNSWAPSPARRITEVWGVPSPIDTVFTRSNCRSKTYIFKGNNYWRFENGILDPGYPKFISVEFEGFDMSGKIVAALPVPATRRRPESVYFFRTGGRVQKYSFGPEATSSCRRKFPIVAGEKQPAGQAGILLQELTSLYSFC